MVLALGIYNAREQLADKVEDEVTNPAKGAARQHVPYPRPSWRRVCGCPVLQVRRERGERAGAHGPVSIRRRVVCRG
ncbi:hypothetical protein [Streptomyces sp. KL116D]|uniref:hypothetical protein n=1 Tax=Streptomyces sp. KL116D TaxID=3045152 RepID=UPI0035577ACC